MGEYLCMKDLELFQGLAAEEKQQVVLLAKKMRYPKGGVVFQQGDAADYIYLIQSGMVQLIKTSEDGREIALGVLKSGDILGENTIFDEAAFGFYAKALTDCFVCQCGKKEFVGLLANPAISLKLIKTLSNKLNNYLEIIADNAFIDAKGRVLNTLKQLSFNHGIPAGGGRMLDFYISHEDLALLVNASRVTVTNSISQLKDEGLIGISQRRFVIYH